MVSKSTLFVALTALVIAFAALLKVHFSGASSVGPEGWLSGSPGDKFALLADQQGGFGITMWEVAYRYGEFKWAADMGDWDYAYHQLAEMEEALLRGIERRPARADNTQVFIKTALSPLMQAIQRDPANLFASSFQQFKAACIYCHAKEDAPLLHMHPWFARFE